ncbi:MAG: hypothetical protein ABH847_05370 [Candidatus Omnitrophota bacterium]
MNKILIAVVALVLAVSLCYAAEEAAPKATEPVGAVVETGGVIVGKLTNVVEKSLGGGKTANSLVLAEDNGKTKIIPLDDTVKVLDAAFNALTLNQLKGKTVSVDVSKEGGKATKVQEVK